MSETVRALWVAVTDPGILLALLGLAFGAGLIVGSGGAHNEFRTCRLLLQTADSATVLRTKPECERWTLPVKTEKP